MDCLVREAGGFSELVSSQQEAHEETWDASTGQGTRSPWHWCAKLSRQNPPSVGAGPSGGFARCCPHADTEISGKEVSDGWERWASPR